MENEELIKVVWSDKPVLTTAQLAIKYKCSPDNISENFNRAKEHFNEGVHYYKLTGGNLRTFKRQSEKIGLPISPYASVVYLWTEEGCLYHCKMINTPEAWAMFGD